MELYRDVNFFMAKSRNKRFKNSIDIGGYKFQYNDREAFAYKDKENSILIFGLIVDSHDHKKGIPEIVGELVDSSNINEFISKTKKLAGRFVIVLQLKNELIVFPDPSCSIQAAYVIDKNYELVLSSNPKLIADYYGFKESAISKQIKSQAEETHPLPYDLTMYDEIKLVIPNHYLVCNNRKVVRYYPLEEVERVSSKKAAQISVSLLENIVKGYASKTNLSIPLTAGIDSRTVMAICKDLIKDIPLYTFYHNDFTENTPDIVIPREITSSYNLTYHCINDLELPENILNSYKNELGSSMNTSVAINSYTYFKSKLNKHAFLNGGIIPIAKSSFGRNLPEIFATPRFLTTKTHNYSKQNLMEVKRWVHDISPFVKVSKVSKFDLFFWEHRIGKWMANSYMNCDLLTNPLNIFNCRELIELWLSVSRTERISKSIHKRIIVLTWPELLNFPINPNRKYEKYIQKSSILYYVACFAKYYSKKRFCGV
jgi:hypothetical protein